ncbi:MAG: class I SAM-dependent methyltransferase [Gemmatimonadota bacterium]
MKGRVDKSVGRRFFGEAPETYDAARPGHANEVYEILRERCSVGTGSRVLEIGPGTGQATRRLLELGADPIVVVEPDPALAAHLRAALADRVDVRVTALEDSELEPAAYDLAAAASSFHWVEEDVGLATILRALRPGGWIALWWTMFGDETRPDPFRQAIDPLFDDIPHGPSGPTEDGKPSFALDSEARFAALRAAGFEGPGHELFRWTRGWDTAGIRALYSTFSPISVLEPGRRTDFLDSVARVAEVEFGGRVEKPLVTSLYLARRPF